MKYHVQLAVLLVLASVAVECFAPRNKFEEGLLKLINKCQNGDVQSLPVAFPSLKPLRIPPKTFVYNGYTMSISEIRVKGLDHLSVEKLYVSPTDKTISMELFIPTLAIRADRYHLKGTTLFIFSTDDQGELKSNVYKLRVQFTVKFGVQGRDTVVTDLKINYSVGDIEINFTDSNEFVNSIINERVLDVIRSGEMTDRFQQIIKEKAREYLRGHTPEEFFDIISNM